MDPNDDIEYLVAGRSDGIWLIDATPDLYYGVTSPVIPGDNQVLFFEEPEWNWLGPQPPGLPVPPGSGVAPVLSGGPGKGGRAGRGLQ